MNRRIGKRRDVEWDGRDNFRGKVFYGYGNEVKGTDFWDKTVLIVGAGAFAFENVRTAIEHGARHVTLLGRRDGTTCPKWIDMIAFLRPLDQNLNTGKSGSMVSFEAWQNCYTDAGLPHPACWREGLLKPPNHTISVSDVAFIAAYHGMFAIKTGEIARFSEDGFAVELKDGPRIDCQIIIKCTGFHLNDDVPKITGKPKMLPNGLMDYNLNYGAEPLLDGAQFGSAKGNTDISTPLGVPEEEVHKGIEVFKYIFPDKASFLEGLSNPFGSGQGGPLRQSSNYMAYLVDHPEEQQAMIKLAGEPPQDVVHTWLSMIGSYGHVIQARLLAGLAPISVGKGA